MRCAAAIIGSAGAKPVASSAAPSSAPTASANSAAPSPHASQSTTSRADVVIRAVTGPLAIMLVFQIAPSRVITKQGSPLPRRNGDNVTRGRAGP